MNKSICTLFTLIIFLAFFTGYTAFAGKEDSRFSTDMNLPFNEKAGDVNPQTGNLTVRYTDLTLPGRAGFDFSFGRTWSLNRSNVFTMYQEPTTGANLLSSHTLEQNNHLGVGWSTNNPYLYTDESSGTRILYLVFGGNVYELDQTGIQVYNSQDSNILDYDLLDLRIYENREKSYSDAASRDFTDLVENFGVNTEDADLRSCYVLYLKNNETCWFREDGKLMLRQDRTGCNRIWYFYDAAEQLVLVIDSVGRMIRFLHDDAGNLSGIEWQVEAGVKEQNGSRVRKQETRRIFYSYQSAEEFTLVHDLKEMVIEYKTPFILTAVQDPMGNITHYDYQEGAAGFTYDAARSHNINVSLLLTKITEMYNPGGTYRNQRCFEYEVPARGMFTKWFYSGYMEYYKISREYFLDRHGRVMNDSRFIYYECGEAGNFNQYSTVIQRSGLKTTYTYTESNESNRDHVLDTLFVETMDGFSQLTDYSYAHDRTKTGEQVFRDERFVYEESFSYDKKGNLLYHRDRVGLITETVYDEIYSIPVEQRKRLIVNGTPAEYETRTRINNLGLVTEEIIFPKQEDGTKQEIVVATYGYDSYGNVITKTDPVGNIVFTIYDDDHLFPVKTYSMVRIASWADGGTVHQNWQKDPEGKKQVAIRSWKVFNSDGRVWIEIDNEGYAIEHYYDKNGFEIEAVLPDNNDFRDFAQPLEVPDGQVPGDDFSDFTLDPGYETFLLSREDNPGKRIIIDYKNDFVKSYEDMDITAGQVKVSGVRKDGLGNVEEEILYGGDDSLYAVKRMSYDTLGRMVSLTDPDAGQEFKQVMINGSPVRRHDKTWIIRYDDLGRQIVVLYPETSPGRTDIKRITYNDLENSITTVDPLGRKVCEWKDWNGNTIRITSYGDINTEADEAQEYNFEYDPLNRKISFTDPSGSVTRYCYDERDLLVEQNYGEESGCDRMEYDDRGLLVLKKDRNGHVSHFIYDELYRNIQVSRYRSEGDYDAGMPEEQVDMVYDNRGNAVRISNALLVEHYIFDCLNKAGSLERVLKDPVLKEQVAQIWGRGIDDQVFAFHYTYNDAGMVTRMVYPDGAVHEFSYEDHLGRLKAIYEGPDSMGLEGFITDIQYNRGGTVTRMIYGNDTEQRWEFDNRKRTSQIQVSARGTVIDDLHYSLNACGDIVKINDNEYAYDGFDRIIRAKILLPRQVDYPALVRSHFGAYQGAGNVAGVDYDPLADLNTDNRINGLDHRLAMASHTDTIYDDEQYSYDKNGNRITLMQNGDEYRYEYGTRNRLLKIRLKKKGSNTSELFTEYEYDANGNTIRRIIHGENGVTEDWFEYDSSNRVVRSRSGNKICEYLYDNAGNRFIKKDPDGMTLYLRHGQVAVAMDVEIAAPDTGYKGKINRYVLSGDLLAGRISTTINEDNSLQVAKSYYHLDHLNSTKLVTNESAEVEVRYEYRAFGGQLKRLDSAGQDTDDLATYSYGGKELDDATNLYYFNARYYDATTGRFISVDPAQDGYNWYVYCGNNPMNCKDPTGLRNWSADLMNIGIGVLKIGTGISTAAAGITIANLSSPSIVGIFAGLGLYVAGGISALDGGYQIYMGLTGQSDKYQSLWRMMGSDVAKGLGASDATAKKVGMGVEIGASLFGTWGSAIVGPSLWNSLESTITLIGGLNELSKMEEIKNEEGGIYSDNPASHGTFLQIINKESLAYMNYESGEKICEKFISFAMDNKIDAFCNIKCYNKDNCRVDFATEEFILNLNN